MGTRRESPVQVYEVLTHDVVQDQDSPQTVQVREDPMQNIIHISLTKEQVNGQLLTHTGSGSCNAPFTLLEVYAGVGREKSMP